jgi:hypothetical protein
MAKRRRFLIAGCHPLMRLVRVVSRTFEAVVLLEAGRVEIIVATRVDSPLLSSVDLILLGFGMPGMSGFNWSALPQEFSRFHVTP